MGLLGMKHKSDRECVCARAHRILLLAEQLMKTLVVSKQPSQLAFCIIVTQRRTGPLLPKR